MANENLLTYIKNFFSRLLKNIRKYLLSFNRDSLNNENKILNWDFRLANIEPDFTIVFMSTIDTSNNDEQCNVHQSHHQERASQKRLSSLTVLPSSTALFTSIHKRSLNIAFESIKSSLDLFTDQIDFNVEKEIINQYNDLLIKNLKRLDLISIDENEDLLKTLTNKEKTLALYLNKVLLHNPLKINIRESFTNNFLAYLLSSLEFNLYPLMLNLQPKYSFEIETITKVSARPDFTVDKNGQIKVVFVDESRHLSNIKLANEFVECQLSGELIAAAFYNYSQPMSTSLLDDQQIYAVRVIGSRFTFYKCKISKKYLSDLSNNLILFDENMNANHINVFRYPSSFVDPIINIETSFGYDYADNLQRLIIIDLLVRLREHVKKY